MTISQTRAYKTKLITNGREAGYLYGSARFSHYVWNWSLAYYEMAMREQETMLNLTAGPGNVKSAFRARIDTEFPWAREYPGRIVDNTIANLQSALSAFWRERKRGTVAANIARKKSAGSWDRWLRKQLKRGRQGVQVEPGWPQFKARGRSSLAFSLNYVKVRDGRMLIPAARGSEWTRHEWRLAERDYIPDGDYKTATFSRDGRGVWYVSVTADYEPEPIETNGEVIGVDIGVAVAVATSDGTLYENNRHLARHEKHLRDLQRKMARQEKAGANWQKTKQRIARTHAKIAYLRQHDRHNITADIVYGKRPAVIKVEDLQVQNMTGRAKPKPDENGNGYLPNKRRQKAGLNRSLLEVSPYELRRQIEYKAAWSGAQTVAVPAFYTSQTCSQCGHTAAENRPTRDRFYCVQCGYEAHADINAACVIRDTNP